MPHDGANSAKREVVFHKGTSLSMAMAIPSTPNPIHQHSQAQGRNPHCLRVGNPSSRVTPQGLENSIQPGGGSRRNKRRYWLLTTGANWFSTSLLSRRAASGGFANRYDLELPQVQILTFDVDSARRW
jgi:hypothetical protein